MERTAVISECGMYRYKLGRCWDHALPGVCFVMLNPSTADASIDDPTIRRCIGFAKAWGYGALEVVNLYTYRATAPSELKKALAPNGPDSGTHLQATAAGAKLLVAAWGNHGTQERAAAVMEVLQAVGREVHCLGQTKTGAPRHPLYVRADTLPVTYRF